MSGNGFVHKQRSKREYSLCFQIANLLSPCESRQTRFMNDLGTRAKGEKKRKSHADTKDLTFF